MSEETDMDIDDRIVQGAEKVMTNEAKATTERTFNFKMMDRCRHLLPEPGADAVGECLKEISAQKKVIEGLVKGLKNCEKDIGFFLVNSSDSTLRDVAKESRKYIRTLLIQGGHTP